RYSSYASLKQRAVYPNHSSICDPCRRWLGCTHFLSDSLCDAALSLFMDAASGSVIASRGGPRFEALDHGRGFGQRKREDRAFPGFALYPDPATVELD